MKFIYILGVAIFFSCSSGEKNYDPSKYLSEKEIDANLWSIMRYLGRAPEGASATDRFNPEYDSSYLAQMKLMSVDAWYQQNGVDYFLVSRRAPSLTEKFVATGGRIIYDSEGEIKEYEEVFRTWKMVPDTLKKRAMILFDKMVRGESLTKYETRFSNGVEFIEFPDERTYYDKTGRTWKVKTE